MKSKIILFIFSALVMTGIFLAPQEASSDGRYVALIGRTEGMQHRSALPCLPVYMFRADPSIVSLDVVEATSAIRVAGEHDNDPESCVWDDTQATLGVPDTQTLSKKFPGGIYFSSPSVSRDGLPDGMYGLISFATTSRNGARDSGWEANGLTELLTSMNNAGDTYENGDTIGDNDPYYIYGITYVQISNMEVYRYIGASKNPDNSATFIDLDTKKIYLPLETLATDTGVSSYIGVDTTFSALGLPPNSNWEITHNTIPIRIFVQGKYPPRPGDPWEPLKDLASAIYNAAKSLFECLWDGPVECAIQWVITLMMDWIAMLITLVISAIDGMMDWQRNQIFSDGIAGAWENVRNVAISLLVLALIIIAFANALQFNIEQYGLNRMIPKIIIAIVLSYLSWAICDFLFEFTDVLVATAKSIGSGATAVDLFRNGITWADAGASVVMLLMVVVLSFLVLIAIITLFIVLLIRLFILSFLVAIAPLAFILMILPWTEKYYKMWWSMFLKWLFMAPLIALILALGLLIAFSDGSTPPSTLVVDDLESTSTIRSSSNSTFVRLFILAATFIFAATIPVKLGGKIMSSWQGMVMKGEKAAYNKGMESKTAHRISNNRLLPKSIRGKNKAFTTTGFKRILSGRKSDIESRRGAAGEEWRTDIATRQLEEGKGIRKGFMRARSRLISGTNEEYAYVARGKQAGEVAEKAKNLPSSEILKQFDEAHAESPGGARTIGLARALGTINHFGDEKQPFRDPVSGQTVMGDDGKPVEIGDHFEKIMRAGGQDAATAQALFEKAPEAIAQAIDLRLDPWVKRGATREDDQYAYSMKSRIGHLLDDSVQSWKAGTQSVWHNAMANENSAFHEKAVATTKSFDGPQLETGFSRMGSVRADKLARSLDRFSDTVERQSVKDAVNRRLRPGSDGS